MEEGADGALHDLPVEKAFLLCDGVYQADIQSEDVSQDIAKDLEILEFREVLEGYAFAVFRHLKINQTRR